jgi:hypothetical protein
MRSTTRISVGIEDPVDLIEDIEQALTFINRKDRLETNPEMSFI